MECGRDEEWCPHLHLPQGGEAQARLRGLHLALGGAAELGLVLASQMHQDHVPENHLGTGVMCPELAHRRG